MRLLVIGVFLSVILAPPFVSATANDERVAEQHVRQFVEAFNSRNLDQMLEAVDENVQWLIVDGTKVSIETEGKPALRESMSRYFKSCSSCKSSLVWVQSAGSRVTAMERAAWTSKNGPKAQRSLSIYEFKDGKILRVYYFPAEVEATTSAPKQP